MGVDLGTGAKVHLGKVVGVGFWIFKISKILDIQ